MKSLIVFALLTLNVCLAQTLPNAPSATPAYLKGDTQIETISTTYNTVKAPSRHPKRLLILAAVNVYAVLGDLKDIRTSEELFHQYGYIEGNTWLVGTHPTPGAYYKRDFGLLLPLLNVPSVIGYIKRKPEIFFMGLAAPAAWGTVHLKQGYDNETTLHQNEEKQ